MIDDFIAHADVDLDGYLSFVEYTSAIRNKDPLLSESSDGNAEIAVDTGEHKTRVLPNLF